MFFSTSFAVHNIFSSLITGAIVGSEIDVNMSA